MKKIFLFGAVLAVAIPLVGFALPFPYWGTNPPLLPCVGAKCVSICQMIKLGQNVIWLGISIVVFAIAPVLIAWCGILVLTAGGAEEWMKQGKKVVTSSLIGMALALGAFLIVNTFFFLLGITFDNPNQRIDWANISCTQEERERPAPSGGAAVPAPPAGAAEGYGWSGATPPAGTLTDAEARRELRDADISVNRPTDCTYAGQEDCTSLMGIPQQAINGAIDIKENCNCQITVTAGTEAGHETHGMGQSILDIRSGSVNNYIEQQIGNSNPNPNQYYTGPDGTRYRYEPKTGEIPHWHVEF